MSYADRLARATEGTYTFIGLTNIIGAIVMLTIVICLCIAAVYCVFKVLFKKEAVEEPAKAKGEDTKKVSEKTSESKEDVKEETKSEAEVSTPATEPIVAKDTTSEDSSSKECEESDDSNDSSDSSDSIDSNHNDGDSDNVIRIEKPTTSKTVAETDNNLLETEDDESWMESMNSIFDQLQGDGDSESDDRTGTSN